MMYLICRVAFKGKPLAGLYKVFADGEVRSREGHLCSFEIGNDYHIIKVI